MEFHLVGCRNDGAMWKEFGEGLYGKVRYPNCFHFPCICQGELARNTHKEHIPVSRSFSISFHVSVKVGCSSGLRTPFEAARFPMPPARKLKVSERRRVTNYSNIQPLVAWGQWRR